MALVKCPECGKEISDRASSCIHCGCPLEHSTPVFAEETTSKASFPISKTNRIVSVAITIAALIATVYSNFAQLRSGLTLSGGVLFYLSFLICVIAAIIYALPFKFCIIASCISTTLYFLISIVCQMILLRTFSFPGLSFPVIFIIVAITAISVYIIIYWLSAVGIMRNSKPLIVSIIVYFFLIFIEMLYSRGYGSLCATVFFASSIPFIIYCIASFLYIRTNIETAYIARKTKIDSEQVQPKQGTYPVQDAPSTGFAVLCFCFPIVGLILYCVWRETLPRRAKSAGLGGLLGFIIGAILTILVYVIALLGI